MVVYVFDFNLSSKFSILTILKFFYENVDVALHTSQSRVDIILAHVTINKNKIEKQKKYYILKLKFDNTNDKNAKPTLQFFLKYHM